MSEDTLFARPKNRPQPDPAPAIDTWVEPTPKPDAQTLKRLTIDIPASLKTRIDIHCATHGTKQKDVLLDILANAFPDPMKGEGST